MMPAPVGNLESYIQAIGQVPMLEIEDERALAKRLRDYGDLDAARKLVLSHLRLVVSIARGYMGYGLPLADLIQEGNIGLMKAVKHFDPDVGGRLAAFAVHWIKSEIHDYVIRNWRMVKVATTKAQRKLFFKLRQNKKHLGWFTESERAQLANDLDVTVKDVAEMETRLAGQDIGFDVDANDAKEESKLSTAFAPSAYLEDEGSDFAQSYENRDYKSYELDRLSKALKELDERARHIIQRRWLDENKATLQELADELKISVERVRQIESQSLNKIKDLIVDKDGASALPLEHRK
ncbi:MAG: RNA polymerase sigma factor RpoH [Succinivibrio sp.]|nr:RNA polymerase sigma factor RpoH [Succinivibrio sp.]